MADSADAKYRPSKQQSVNRDAKPWGQKKTPNRKPCELSMPDACAAVDEICTRVNA
jgi:hypothetical protein